MKLIVMMWILYLNDLSSQKIIYDGDINECLQESIIFNFENQDKAYSGCYMEVKQPDYLEE